MTAVYRRSVTALSATMIILGVVMVVIAVSRGGGVGLLLGPLFVAAGAGRIVLLRRSRN